MMVRWLTILLCVGLLGCPSSHESPPRPVERTPEPPPETETTRRATPPSDEAQAEVLVFLEDLRRVRCEWAIWCEAVVRARQQAQSCHPRGTTMFANLETRDQHGYWLEGRSSFHPERAAACLRAFGRLCSVDIGGPCGNVFEGSVEPGGDCGEFACTASSTCTPNEAGGGSVCVAHSREGGSCVNGCRSGLTCIDGVCQPFASVGAACRAEAPNPCGPLAICLDGRCVPFLVGRGEPCAPPFRCDEGLVCRRTSLLTGTCGDGLGVGEACDGFAPCAAGNRCVDETCRVIALPAAACGAEVCPSGFSCSDGVCTPIPDFRSEL